MASGFFILKDGRCLAPRWTVYDCIIEMVIRELSNVEDKDAQDFCYWLQTLIPHEGDDYNGFGGFIRRSNGEDVRRWLDLRELTEKNQILFWNSLKKSTAKINADEQPSERNEALMYILNRFLRMKNLADNGDNPDNLTDWVKGYTEPSTGKQIGPGW